MHADEGHVISWSASRWRSLYGARTRRLKTDNGESGRDIPGARVAARVRTDIEFVVKCRQAGSRRLVHPPMAAFGPVGPVGSDRRSWSQAGTSLGGIGLLQRYPWAWRTPRRRSSVCWQLVSTPSATTSSR